jgi:hypothetical protein
MNARHFAARTIFMKHRRTKSHKCVTLFKTRPHDETFVRFCLALFTNVSRFVSQMFHVVVSQIFDVVSQKSHDQNLTKISQKSHQNLTKISQKSHKRKSHRVDGPLDNTRLLNISNVLRLQFKIIFKILNILNQVKDGPIKAFLIGG